jgi:vacuolar-type H+-ATPase subunit H
MENQSTAKGRHERSVSEGGDGITEKARHMKDEAQEKVSDAAHRARDLGGDLVEEGKERAQELGDRAGEMARSQGDHQRERVAQGVRTFADALRRGSQDLPADRREYGRYIEDVADRVEGVSRYLGEHDVDTLTREARRFAREQTPLFLSGAFTLGMLGARFLKASGSEARDDGSWTDDRPRGGREVRRAPAPGNPEHWTAPYEGAKPYGSAEPYGRQEMRPPTGGEEGGYG